MITIGDIETALKADLFPKNSNTDLGKRCRKVEETVKHQINNVLCILNHYVVRPDLPDIKISRWKEEKIKTCMANLVEYLEELVGELDRNKIVQRCDKPKSLPFGFIDDYQPNLTILFLNSYYGAIIADVYWIQDISIIEALDISLGKIALSELGNRTPNKISKIEALLNDNKAIFAPYNNQLTTVLEAFKCYHSHCLKAFNSLLIISIEGLTRALGQYLIKQQNLEVDPYSSKFNSLDSFLRNIPWHADIPINKTQLALITGQYNKNIADDMSDYFNPVNVTLKQRLDFLRRRFKENRDLILHGQETEYDKPLNGFINISALEEVLKTIAQCHNIYKK